MNSNEKKKAEILKLSHMEEALNIEIREFGRSFFSSDEMGTINRIVGGLEHQRDVYKNQKERLMKQVELEGTN